MKKAAGVFLKSLVFLCIIFMAVYLNRTGLLQNALDRIDRLGHWGPLAFIFIYTVTCIFFVPSFIFTFASGVLFGFWKGVLLSLIGTGLGSVGAFLTGRYLARNRVKRVFASNQEFHRLNAAIRKKGWKIVLLARLSPVFPFLIGNYAFGLTPLRPWHYMFASMTGSIPSASVYTYAGTVTGSLAVTLNGRERSPAEWALLFGGLLVTLALALYLKRVAQKALED